MSISKIVIPNFVWVVQMKDTKHTFFCISRDFHSVTLVMSQGCDFGAQGSPGGGGQKCFFFFLKMVMWHIKPRGMTSRTKCKKTFHPRVKLVTLG